MLRVGFGEHGRLLRFLLWLVDIEHSFEFDLLSGVIDYDLARLASALLCCFVLHHIRAVKNDRVVTWVVPIARLSTGAPGQLPRAPITDSDTVSTHQSPLACASTTKFVVVVPDSVERFVRLILN